MTAVFKGILSPSGKQLINELGFVKYLEQLRTHGTCPVGCMLRQLNKVGAGKWVTGLPSPVRRGGPAWSGHSGEGEKGAGLRK